MAIGVDFASTDGNSQPDFVKAKKAGVQFAIPRAVYGRRVNGQLDKEPVFIDPTWARDKDAIVAAGLKRSAYLFLCLKKINTTTPDPEDQAEAFFDYVKLDPSKDWVPMFDVEEASTIMSPDEMYQWVARCAIKLRDLYGAWPGMYTSARVWAENLKHASPGMLLNCPLWLAKPWPWPVKSPIHLDGATGYSPILIPEFGDQWFVYQYAGDATLCPGFNSTVDASRFHTFGEGAKGAHVVWAQKRLKVTADGIFGPATKAAVQRLQVMHGLAADGVIGPATFAPLSWLLP